MLLTEGPPLHAYIKKKKMFRVYVFISYRISILHYVQGSV